MSDKPVGVKEKSVGVKRKPEVVCCRGSSAGDGGPRTLKHAQHVSPIHVGKPD